jgi:hypothetical protein
MVPAAYENLAVMTNALVTAGQGASSFYAPCLDDLQLLHPIRDHGASS